MFTTFLRENVGFRDPVRIFMGKIKKEQKN